MSKGKRVGRLSHHYHEHFLLHTCN